jgi:histidine triad (HIT) family protein
MNTDPNCIFCQIVARKLPSYKFMEDEHFIAILDIHPNNLGHSLVIPKEHSQNLFDISPEVLCQLGMFTQKVAKAVKKGTNADGVNLWMNNGGAANQLIMHSHFHIIPRFQNDKILSWKAKPQFSPEDFDKIIEKIKSSIICA